MLISSLILLSAICGVDSDVEECRNQYICENGGTCLLSSALSVGKKCDDGEVYHMEQCYSFNEHPMKWVDAAKYCEDNGKVLALTETDDDQTFYAGYIQGMLSATKAWKPGVTGVWTSVRSLPNGSEPAWVAFPGSYVVDRQYWQPGEPNIYPSYDDVCVSLQQETMYRSWMSQSCDALNYVVCKRKAVDQAASQKRLAQCICPEGYGGLKCEQRTDEELAQNISCATVPFEFACRNGGTIHVEYASYGAVEGYACSRNMLSVKQTCSNPNSLKTITNKCEGLTYCSIPKLTDIFPETPCPVLDELYLHYRFKCLEDRQSVCASGAFYMSGRCFTINTKRKRLSQSAAQQACRKEGGYLASNIDSSMDSELSRQVVRQGKDGDAFWIDLKVNDEGFPVWNDGSSLTYRNLYRLGLDLWDTCWTYGTHGTYGTHVRGH
ncbi:hypothetical protein Y032_0083g1663 [Ancylostoma ceylanicum]|uniref:Lectin C-type domain protein n=1 Tax=Ancylostoma ceylanicum TaxID=53326 RepID=A0A016TRH7_9BILA|nr:hypothetical protein Y032_0083g1663 [Ancylostoma ceylanicum]